MSPLEDLDLTCSGDTSLCHSGTPTHVPYGVGATVLPVVSWAGALLGLVPVLAHTAPQPSSHDPPAQVLQKWAWPQPMSLMDKPQGGKAACMTIHDHFSPEGENGSLSNTPHPNPPSCHMVFPCRVPHSLPLTTHFCLVGGHPARPQST